MISTIANPASFNDFTNSSGGNQLVVPYLQSGGTLGCIAVNAGTAGIAGVGDGSNITLQVAFNGGDGNLYQVCFICAPLWRQSVDFSFFFFLTCFSRGCFFSWTFVSLISAWT
jgi:hypothetical protein